MEVLLEDRLGKERFVAFSKTSDYWHSYQNFIKKDQSPWFVQPKKNYFLRALKKTEEELTVRFGVNEKNWNWGALHKIEYQHLLGKQWPLNYIFNLGPYSSPGGYSQLNNFAASRGDKSFMVKTGQVSEELLIWVSR